MEIPLRNQQAAAVAVAVETARRGSLQAALQYTWMGFADTVKSTEEDEGLDMDERHSFATLHQISLRG